MEQTQKSVEEALTGKTIIKLEFKDSDDKNNLDIKSIHTEDGYLYNVERGRINISHPESEQETEDFFTVLEKVTNGGIVTFNAKHLSNQFIEEEIKKKAKEIGANGWGRTGSRQDFGYQVTYRFDMPE